MSWAAYSLPLSSLLLLLDLLFELPAITCFHWPNIVKNANGRTIARFMILSCVGWKLKCQNMIYCWKKKQSILNNGILSIFLTVDIVYVCQSICTSIRKLLTLWILLFWLSVLLFREVVTYTIRCAWSSWLDNFRINSIIFWLKLPTVSAISEIFVPFWNHEHFGFSNSRTHKLVHLRQMIICLVVEILFVCPVL